MGRNLPVPNEAAPAIPYSPLNLRINKDNKEADIDMDSKNEVKVRWINIMIKDEHDNKLFEKQMIVNEDNVKIKPFLTLINEFCQVDKSLKKYQKFFKKVIYRKFGIPDYESLLEDEQTDF